MTAPTSMDARELHEEVARLDRQKAELGEQIEGQRVENEGHREKLRLLEGGLFRGKGRGRRIGLLLVVLLLVGGGGYIGYCSVKAPMPRTRAILAKPLRPHVLITSEPSGPRARVSFTSDRMPASVARKGRGTPFFFDAPPRGASYTITVEADGFAPQTRTLRVEPRGGIHWHAVLEPRADRDGAR